ncbi:MAG: hypothetical protein SFY92_10300 [Verrucomicrobiae bacterium]|nr:hypothetical protein [Verrucomicrobiae bacterium]
MNRIQWLILNILSGVLALLILVSIIMVQLNQRSGQEIGKGQTSIQMARQSEVILRQLALRLAQGSDADPALRGLLQKYQLNVSIPGPDGKPKNYP